jgi:hypothetical protein
MDRKRVRKLWDRWKALDPELTIFWWDENRKVWMGGEHMGADEKGRPFYNEFEMGDTLYEVAEFIRNHIAKAQAGE